MCAAHGPRPPTGRRCGSMAAWSGPSCEPDSPKERNIMERTKGREKLGPAFLFDLDGTLVDSVYQHVLAWREALEAAGIELAVWRIHRRIGMSGGLLVNAPGREAGRSLTPADMARIWHLPVDGYLQRIGPARPLPGAPA